VFREILDAEVSAARGEPIRVLGGENFEDSILRGDLGKLTGAHFDEG